MGRSLLKISVGFSSIGLGGIVFALCPDAIAAPLPASENAPPNTPTLALAAQSFEPVDALNISSPEPSASRDHSLDIQPLPQRSDTAELATELTNELTTELALAPWAKPNLEQATDSALASPKTQICRSLQACDRTFTIAIDATGATAVGDLADAPLASLSAAAPSLAQSAHQKPQHSPKNQLIETAPKEQVQSLTAEEKDEASKETGSLDNLIEALPRRSPQPRVDDELGNIRVNPLRSRGDEDLGVLRLLQKAAAPPKVKRPIAFVTGRLGYFNSQNTFRLDTRENEQIYQSGLSVAAFPSLSEDTSLYAIAETNLGRFEQAGDRGYNEIELQLGVRQKLLPSTYAQIGLRNQQFYSFGYERKILGINYIDTVISHRSIFNSRTWLDSFYQARLGFADAKRSSRFRQTFTFSLNYGINKDLRTSLLYQLDLEDYTQIARYDVYQQVIGTISYRLTPESRISLFGGTRFGNSSSSDPALSKINLDDTFYGAGLTVNLPLF